MIDIIEFVRKLQEHARKRKTALQKIDSLQLPITAHLIKIAVYPHHPSVSHWQREVLNWFYQISLIHIKGQGVLKEKEYFRLLYEEPLTPIDVIERGIKGLLTMYRNISPCVKDINQTAEKIDENVKYIMKNLSKDLANGAYDPDKYRNLLENYRKTFLKNCDD